ncbi:MAG TPA: 5-(carboxyamino)imidazole ribonucleotide synthase [Alphaproteobacteria bacterium]|nr:5-(carboxyamino)imidazole ribonucleotide synthase [Alphaproteobacteria bacterium]
MSALPPGGAIGILGGGQLGRMTAIAAARLGYRVHIFDPDRDAPASAVAATTTHADYADQAAIASFAATIDVATYEFENIAHEGVAALAALKPVRPGPEVLRIAQDRLLEKDFVNQAGIATARYVEVAGAASLMRAARDLGFPAVLKSVRMGYDGKGQAMIRADSDPEALWMQLGAPRGVVETFVDFACEISVIVARGLDGQTLSYVPVENQHKNHILDTTIAPARIASEIAMKAEAIARHIAEKLELVGLLAVEMFVTRDGQVLVNELAPRPHNSGHWTIDACLTSQFEQLVRAICGWPLGSPERHSDAIMKNLIGEEVNDWPEIVKDPAAKLHLYGKREIRPGRKMGHVTRLSPRADR